MTSSGGAPTNFSIAPTCSEHRLLHFDGGITLSYEQVGAIEKFVGAPPEEVIDGIRHRSGQFLLEAWNTMIQGLFSRFVVDAGLLEGA